MPLWVISGHPQPKLLKPCVVAYKKSGKSGPANRRAIVDLVRRDGSVRSFQMAHADKVVIKIVSDNIAKVSRLYADESRLYFGASEHFVADKTIRNSSWEYVGGDVHSNATEGYLGTKNGLRGVYQHCREKHLLSPHVRVRRCGSDVCFTPKSRHMQCSTRRCPLYANSGHTVIRFQSPHTRASGSSSAVRLELARARSPRVRCDLGPEPCRRATRLGFAPPPRPRMRAHLRLRA